MEREGEITRFNFVSSVSYTECVGAQREGKGEWVWSNI